MDSNKSIGAAFAEHIGGGDPQAITAQGLLSTKLAFGPLLTGKLAGATLPIGDNVVVQFPKNLQAIPNRQAQTIVFTGTKPVAKVDSLIDVSANIQGVKLSFDRIDVLLEGFPDFTIYLVW